MVGVFALIPFKMPWHLRISWHFYLSRETLMAYDKRQISFFDNDVFMLLVAGKGSDNAWRYRQ